MGPIRKLGSMAMDAGSQLQAQMNEKVMCWLHVPAGPTRPGSLAGRN